MRARFTRGWYIAAAARYEKNDAIKTHRFETKTLVIVLTGPVSLLT